MKAKNAMNLRSVRRVRDSDAQSAIKPVPCWSLPPSGHVSIARVPDVFIAGLPAGQNPRASTIELKSHIRKTLPVSFGE